MRPGRKLVETDFTRLPAMTRATIGCIRSLSESLDVSQYWEDVNPERVAGKLRDLRETCAELLEQIAPLHQPSQEVLDFVRLCVRLRNTEGSDEAPVQEAALEWLAMVDAGLLKRRKT